MNESKLAYLSFVIYSLLDKPSMSELTSLTNVKLQVLTKWKKQFLWDERQGEIISNNLKLNSNGENIDSTKKVVQSLQKLFDGIIKKLSQKKNEIESMDLDAQLRTMQSISKTIQSLIKVLGIKNEISDSDLAIQKFTKQILVNSNALALAEQLLGLLSEEDFKVI